MPTVEAKSKVRQRHSAAIKNFKEWQKEHPRAQMKTSIRAFDKFVDQAYYEMTLK